MNKRVSKTHKPNPGTISISIKHQNGGRMTAHYVFPDFEFSECAFDELREHAHRFSKLASIGRHACSDPKGLKGRKKSRISPSVLPFTAHK
jgi:hypothetical protein